MSESANGWGWGEKEEKQKRISGFLFSIAKKRRRPAIRIHCGSFNEQQLETLHAYLNNFNDIPFQVSSFSIMSLLPHSQIHQADEKSDLN